MLSKLLASIVLLVILPASNVPVAAKKPKGQYAYAGDFKWQRKTNLNDVPQHCQPTTEGHRPTHAYVDLSKKCEESGIPGTSCVNFVDGTYGEPMDVADVDDLKHVVLVHVNKTSESATTYCDGPWRAEFDKFKGQKKPPKELVDLWADTIELLKQALADTSNVGYVVFQWRTSDPYHWKTSDSWKKIVVRRN